MTTPRSLSVTSLPSSTVAGEVFCSTRTAAVRGEEILDLNPSEQSKTALNKQGWEQKQLLLMCRRISACCPALMGEIWHAMLLGFNEQVKVWRATYFPMQWVIRILSPNIFTGVSRDHEQLDQTLFWKCLLVAFYWLCTTSRGTTFGFHCHGVWPSATGLQLGIRWAGHVHVPCPSDWAKLGRDREL